ncbi:MAG: peptide-methionine (S)-S-oxide reductase MsrA [Mycoplasmatales bacterium]
MLPKNPNLNVEFNEEELTKIYLAGGCFWGAEAFLQRIYGVKETYVGYANGQTINPTYEEVCSGKTGFVETVCVIYDSSKITLSTLIDEFFKIIDPTSFNKQGPDKGEQYRTGIYYQNLQAQQIAKEKIEEYQPKYQKPILVEVKPLKNFYQAEEYHQDYLKKNPNGYCHVDLSLLKHK